jgi:signal transduction histidine kinase
LQHLPDLSQRLVGMLTDRVRTYTEVEQQSQKLAALGKLSAGLAHELNNPSAAARRSAGILRECLARLREAVRTSSIGPEDCAMLAEKEEKIRVSLKPPQYKDEFERVDREEAIQTWLEQRGVDNAWQLGPLLAEANLSDADLETFAKAAGPSRTNSTTARRGSPISSKRSRNIPTWIRRPCRRSISPRVSTRRSRSCITN